MQLGMIGLGRMGANMVRRLMRAGHECVVYDRAADSVKALAGEGATGALSLQELASRLTPPRAVCMMVPVAGVDAVIESLGPHLTSGDALIDGGNSHYPDDIARAARLSQRGIHYVD